MNSGWNSENLSRPHSLIVGTILILAVCISLVISPHGRGVFGALLAAVMLAIAVTDARSRIIPDQLTAAAIVLAFIHEGFVAPDAGVQTVALAAAGSIAAALPFLILMIGYRALRGRDGLGLGDVKLAAVAGAWLSWLTIIIVVDIAALCALAVTVFLSRVHGRPLSATTVLPFGLFLAPAIWLGWLFESLLF